MRKLKNMNELLVEKQKEKMNKFSEVYYSNKEQIDEMIIKSVQEAASKNWELVQNLFSIKDIQVDNQRNATSS